MYVDKLPLFKKAELSTLTPKKSLEMRIVTQTAFTYNRKTTNVKETC